MENLPPESEIFFDCDPSCERQCNPRHVASYLLKNAMEEFAQAELGASITAEIACTGPLPGRRHKSACNMTLNYTIYDIAERAIDCSGYEPVHQTQNSLE